jgi:tetratricopeptide (TPR) repeat protein
MAEGQSDMDPFAGFLLSHSAPDSAEYHNALGINFLAHDDLENAVKEYRVAIRLSPMNLRYHCNLGSALRQLGIFQEARAEYELALHMDTGDPLTHCNYGNLLTEMGKNEEALAEYRRAIRLDPTWTDACYFIGALYWRARDLGKAEAAYLEALQTIPDSTSRMVAFDRLGIIYTEWCHFDKAEVYLTKSLELDSNRFLIHYSFAQMYWDSWENSDKSRGEMLLKVLNHAQKAVELDPQDEDAQIYVNWALTALATFHH